jgi:hypothetical protein
VKRPYGSDSGRIWLGLLAVALILAGAGVAVASLPARPRIFVVGGIFIVVFCFAAARLVRTVGPGGDRRASSGGPRDPAAADERDPAAEPPSTLRDKIVGKVRRKPHTRTDTRPDRGPAPAGTEPDTTAGFSSADTPGTDDVAASGDRPRLTAKTSLEAITVGPVTELDRTTVPLPPRVIAGTGDSSAYFGGRVVGRPFEVRGASLPGLSHLLEGRPSQDCLAAGWLPHRDSLLIAAADGLGSQTNSGLVATFALRRLLDLGQNSFYQQYTLAQLVEQVRRETADKLRDGAHDGATTLVAAELRAVPGGAETDIVAVGDSEAWQLNATTWQALHHERGDGTRALPQHPATQAAHLHLPTGTVLMLATDGVAEALGSGRSGLAQELMERFARPPRPVEFANLIEFRHEMYNDDRSAIAVWLVAGR